MKLRIKNNLLQFRITRRELVALVSSRRLEETVHFSTTGDSRMTYAVEVSPTLGPTLLKYQADEILIVLSQPDVERWAQEQLPGLYTTIDLGERGTLELLFEKDFDILEQRDVT